MKAAPGKNRKTATVIINMPDCSYVAVSNGLMESLVEEKKYGERINIWLWSIKESVEEFESQRTDPC